MKFLKAFIKMAPVLLLLSSCSQSENNKMIIGSWSGAEWLVNGQPSGRNVQSTSFTFNDKGGYTFEYADSKQAGTYKVENDMLFTTASGEREMMVKIVKLSNDSLVFDMSRGGEPERLTLLRKN